VEINARAAPAKGAKGADKDPFTTRKYSSWWYFINGKRAPKRTKRTRGAWPGADGYLMPTKGKAEVAAYMVCCGHDRRVQILIHTHTKKRALSFPLRKAFISNGKNRVA